MKRFLVLAGLVAALGFAGPAGAKDLPAFDALASGLEMKAGLIPLYLDLTKGRAYLALPVTKDGRAGTYLYAHALSAGLGSNPVGLDRGSGSGIDVVALRILSGRLMIEAQNTGFRASAKNAAERRAVRESFARSVLWSGPLSSRPKDGRVLVDITGFLVRDASGVAARLAAAGQGKFRLDPKRSVLDAGAALAFPQNLEFDAIVTFASAKPGPEVRATAAVPQSITLTQHHSFIKLPDDGYTPRRADPRTANFSVDYLDFSAPLDAPLMVHLARRFRLQKIHPGAAPSKVKKPIVYYVDNGAPEPVRGALIEGISWWARAFEAAGFIDAFQVKVLPEGVNPLDVRYNVVQWAHRATRGWSYGGGIADPRTGEMIKALVTLGSQRVRQDRMIFEGLLGTGKTGSGAPDDPVQLALARIRQLGAHEVGHTLGFAHNMGASTVMGGSSVMDYPAPDVRARPDGSLDVSHAYGTGIGAWDRFTVSYLYSEVPAGQSEKAYLDGLIAKAYGSGLRYVADRHARPPGSANPYGSLWDTGADPVASLANTMAVRAAALRHFGLRNIRDGEPLSDLQKVLVPVYLYHRYQMEAAAKAVGGYDFAYPVKGDALPRARVLDPAYQRRALREVLKTVSPAALDLPDSVLEVLNPRAQGAEYTREMFVPSARPAFDVINAAQTAAALTFAQLAHPARAARLVAFHRRDAHNPGLEEVLRTVSDDVFAEPEGEPARQGEIRRAVQGQWIAALIALADDAHSPDAVKARTRAHLAALRDRLRRGGTPADRAARALMRARITRFLERPASPSRPVPPAPKAPPGSPIGASTGVWEDFCWLCSP